MPVKPPIVKAYILVHDYLEVDPAELRKHLGRLKDFEVKFFLTPGIFLLANNLDSVIKLA